MQSTCLFSSTWFQFSSSSPQLLFISVWSILYSTLLWRKIIYHQLQVNDDKKRARISSGMKVSLLIINRWRRGKSKLIIKKRENEKYVEAIASRRRRRMRQADKEFDYDSGWTRARQWSIWGPIFFSCCSATSNYIRLEWMDEMSTQMCVLFIWRWTRKNNNQM